MESYWLPLLLLACCSAVTATNSAAANTFSTSPLGAHVLHRDVLSTTAKGNLENLDAFPAILLADGGSVEDDEAEDAMPLPLAQMNMNEGKYFPVTEAKEDEYYGSKPQEITRLTDINWEKFAYYARRGIPVVVTDAARDMQMKGWTCDRMRKEYAKEKMRPEYTGKATKDNTPLGDKNWINTKTPLKNGPADKGPNFAPWYFDMKERTGAGRQKARTLTELPYFLRDDTNMNGPSVNESAEFWFSAPEAGAKAHTDAHCEATMSIQLSGQKRWRLGLLPRVVSGASVRRTFDGDVNTTVWRPHYEVTLKEGEALFFPPGMIHETRNVGDTCAASVTYQYSFPFPSIYVRTWAARLLPTGSSIGECRPRWYLLASIATRLGWPTSIDNAQKTAATVFAKLDADKDGSLSPKEIENAVLSWRAENMNQIVLEEAPKAAQTAARKMLAKDILAYHDLDEDGKVSQQEYTHNFLSFSQVILTAARTKAASASLMQTAESSGCRGTERTHLQHLWSAVESAKTAAEDAAAREQIAKTSPACVQLAAAFDAFARQTQLPVGVAAASDKQYFAGVTPKSAPNDTLPIKFDPASLSRRGGREGSGFRQDDDEDAFVGGGQGRGQQQGGYGGYGGYDELDEAYPGATLDNALENKLVADLAGFNIDGMSDADIFSFLQRTGELDGSARMYDQAPDSGNNDYDSYGGGPQPGRGSARGGRGGYDQPRRQRGRYDSYDDYEYGGRQDRYGGRYDGRYDDDRGYGYEEDRQPRRARERSGRGQQPPKRRQRYRDEL